MGRMSVRRTNGARCLLWLAMACLW
ncbi:MAG: hypothetical protein QG552_1718, partial [Thermodesulfobacteriota bacterium]|nr:hypothetical protein [Thermodesulfobacteriota bacterium]